MGPKDPRSTVLTAEDEAIAVAFRRHTLLPLDDCLYSLQATIPHLTRSSLHRLFQRHDISRLRRRRLAAIRGPNLITQQRTASRLTSIPRWASSSSTSGCSG